MPVTARPARPRWAGLDGMRALAVAAVVAFHFTPGAVPGGFLGVDVFFVLSGYLITRMIATEYLRSGGFRFGNFYLRRARRLLPGLGLLLVCALAAAAVWRDQLATIRPATTAAVTYVSNWWLAFAHQSYFVSVGRPSMLMHLWSLAVEEQFYLVWPVLAVAVLSLRGGATDPRRSVRRLAIVAGLLAVASAAELATLALREHAPYQADASRLYYGTDTHGSALLVGAALGALAAGRLSPRPGDGKGSRPRRLVWLTDAAAVGALVTLLVVVCTVDEFSPTLYRVGFLLVAVITGIAVASVARRGSRVGRALDARPLRWLAARSYSIYLWHWPIAVLTRPGVDVHWPAPVVQLARVGLTLALADVSYRWVEHPVRTTGLRTSLGNGARRITRVVVGEAPIGARLATAGAVTGFLIAVGVLVAAPHAPRSAAQEAFHGGHGGRALPIGTTSAPATPATTPPPNHAVPGPELRRPGPVVTSPTPIAAGPLPRISAFGDSVVLGARGCLDRSFPGGSMDAVEGRQADPILHDVDTAARAGRLNPVVLISVGDNGIIDPDSLRRTLAGLHAIRRVVVVNLRVDRPWEKPNNELLSDVVPDYPNARLVDWHGASAAHHNWFYDDGIHLTPHGASEYATLVARAARGA